MTIVNFMKEKTHALFAKMNITLMKPQCLVKNSQCKTVRFLTI